MAAVDDEEISSLPLPSGADNSRNEISEVGLMLLANEDRLRSDLQVDGCASESHAPRQAPLMHDATPRSTRSFAGHGAAPNDMRSDPLAHRSSAPHSRTPDTVYYHEEDRRSKTGSLARNADDSSVSEAIESLGRNFAAQTSVDHAENDQDEDDWVVPSNGLLGEGGGAVRDDGAASLANAPSAPVVAVPRASIDNAFAQPRDARSAPNAALGRVDYSQTERAMQSAARVGSYGELRSPSRARYAEQSSSAESSSAQQSERSQSLRASSVSHTTSQSETDVSRTKSHHRRRHRRHRRSNSRRPASPERREQTYAEFQESIRDRVKQQEDMEKREMLLLFYQKQQYEKAEVPQKFFREGLNSDLMEMRWWYYKLIRDTRINDEVADLKSKIVNGSRFALFLNTQIGNPLNLRLDKNFPKELANVLNTSTDRHLREHIKSKCGVSGPKPRPWSHILRDLWECGLNYHQNSLAMEESEKKRAKTAPQATQASAAANPAPAPPTFDAFHSLQQQQAYPQQQYQRAVPMSGSGQMPRAAQDQYQRLLEQQAMQRRMFQGQLQQQQQQQQQQRQPPLQQANSAAGRSQPNRAPLRNVFRNMSGDMRQQAIPQHLQPPKPQTRAAAGGQNVSLAEAARAMRSQLGVPAHLAPPAARPTPATNQPPAPKNPAVATPPALPRAASQARAPNARAQPPLQRLPTPATQKKSLNKPVPVPLPTPPRTSPKPSVGMRLPRNNPLWSRLQNPPPHLPPVPNQKPPHLAQRATTDATEQQQTQTNNSQNTFLNDERALTARPALAPHSDVATTVHKQNENSKSGKRSIDDLMQELQSAHDEDEQSYENNAEIFGDNAGEMPDLPQDRFADTVALMEDFNNDTSEVDDNARRMASLHDIDDVLGLSLSDVKPSTDAPARTSATDKSAASRSRRSRRKRRAHAANKESAAKDTASPTNDARVNENTAPAAEERARTPSPQPDSLRMQRGSGRASIGRSGQLQIEY